MRCAFHFVILIFSLAALKANQEETATTRRLDSLDDYLKSQLASYEVLHPAKLINRRSVGEDATEHLHFGVFNKQFHLVLQPSHVHSTQPLLKVYVVKNDTIKPADVNLTDLYSTFYTGYVDDEPNSRVSGYCDEGHFHLTIYEESDVLTIEPLSLLTGNLSDGRLLAYYDSSINSSQYRCGMDATSGEDAAPTYPHPRPAASSPPQRSRRRRRSPPSVAPTRVCRLQIVADHTFVRHAGSVTAALKALIKSVDDINEIYLGTEFPDLLTNITFTGIGFELSSLVAMDGPSVLSTSEPLHFNAPQEPDSLMSASRLLDAFGDSTQNGLNFRHCLNHLVTFRQIENKVLGLAFMGSGAPKYIGGVCSNGSISTFDRGRRVARNVGVTSFCNMYGIALLTRKGTLIIAHELSHNFGSPHDSKVRCLPGPEAGGHFLMHELAVSGSEANHDRLSSCSRELMAKVIKGRYLDCLTAPTGQVCGNNRREAGEDCDAGPVGDHCCTSDCHLQAGAVCSDANSPCCRRCRPAPAGVVCRRASPLWPCRVDSVCDGRADACPPAAAALPDGTDCPLGAAGACRGGRCESACGLAGMWVCECSSEPCVLCCVGADGGCSAYRHRNGSGPIRQPNCSRSADSVPGGMTVRLWRLATRPGIGSVVVHLRNNMVLIVICLSLLIWAPACGIDEYRAQLDN